MAKRKRQERAQKTLLDLKPPKGMAYEAKVVSLYDEPVSPQIMRDIELAGWKPVPQGRHRRTPVVWGGMRLMERPLSLQAKAMKSAVDLACELTSLAMIDIMSGAKLARDLPPGFTAVVDPPELPMVATDKGWEPNPRYKPQDA